MPELSQENLTALAASGAPNPQIVAALGRKMTPEERQIVERVRVVKRLKRLQAGPASNAERQQKFANKNSLVEWRECADPKRRRRLEADRPAWLRYYFGGVFFRPFENPHLAIINGSTDAITSGGRFAVAAERGIGKSVIVWGLVVCDAFVGASVFPAYVPWQIPASKRAFRFWKNALVNNPLLLADYPEFCAPFAHSKGVSQRLAGTVWLGGPNDGQPTGAALAVTDGLIVMPDSRGAIGSASINGNPRGLNHPTADGRVLRPTSAILDDVQDRDVAKSERMVADTIAIIDGDVAGMGEAGKKLPMLMTGNCIAPGDVMAHYLAAENWHSIRVPCVESWPEGWGDGDGPAGKLWEEWHERFKRKEKHRQYYKANKAAMVKGFVLSAPKTFAGKREFPDAFCAVMESYFRMGKSAFHAEKQQKPLDPIAEAAVRVTPEIVASRAIGPPRGVVPEWVTDVVTAADINPGTQSRLGARITWACAGYGASQTAHVIAYGIYRLQMPIDPTPMQQIGIVFAGLNEIRKQTESNYGSHTLGYDARGWYTKGGVTRGDVLNYRNIQLPGLKGQAIGLEGHDSTHYYPNNKTAIKKYESCHLAKEDDSRRGKIYHIAWDSDWHNLQQLKAWLATPGAPGSCSLYRGNHDGEFLQQVTTRAFMGMVQKYRGQVYDWNRTVGNDDYGDCLAMCRALAAYHGIGTGGQTEKRKRVASVVIGGRTITAGDENEQDKGSGNVETAGTGRGAIIGRRRW